MYFTVAPLPVQKVRDGTLNWNLYPGDDSSLRMYMPKINKRYIIAYMIASKQYNQLQCGNTYKEKNQVAIIQLDRGICGIPRHVDLQKCETLMSTKL